MACFIAPMTAAMAATAGRKKFSRRYHIDWLISMLWGGVLMLIVEHIAHREIVPYPPFFTAGLSHIIPEIIRVGIPMTVTIFAVWGIMVYIGERVTKAKEKSVKLVEG